MPDLKAWLGTWGLDQLLDTLAAQDVDLNALQHLSESDIRDLGLSIGMRRRLSHAIAASWPRTMIAPASEATPSSGHEAERRQLTVVFVDVVGSTELSRKLDPEEMSSVLNAYRTCCSDAIVQRGGRIARFFGDGILAYFGYPSAHENDAERCVLAALAIVRDVPNLRPLRDIVLSVRVGIATGLVMVGEFIGKGESEELTVVGETPIVASRLQSEAPPNGIFMSASTHRLTAGLFRCANKGLHHLKGFNEPASIWQILGEARAENRFQALRARAMAPMIGRTGQLETLRACWRRAVAGESNVVVVSGEAGLGKSRLVRAMRETLAHERPFVLAHYCSPHHQTSPLHPVISQMERAAGIVLNDTGEIKLRKLEQLLLRAGADPAETMPLIAPMLSIPLGSRYPPSTVSPEHIRDRTLTLLLRVAARLAADRPIFCLFEDIHWIDPTSLELLERARALFRTLPMLLVVTTRPSPDAARPSFMTEDTRMTLPRLSKGESELLVLHATAGSKLAPGVVAEIVARADGVPLFVEELTRAVYEAGLLVVGSNAATTRGMLPATMVPATLHDSLMARLDRMSPIKPVAQLAAVLGRVFSLDLLRAVAPPHLQPVETAIEALVEAEIIYPVEDLNPATYQFKHALLQDVAYQSLLRSTRQRYHEHTALTLDTLFPKIGDALPEFVAHHYAEAGLAKPAIAYWLKAAKRATQRSSNLEAIAQLTRGAALLGGIADHGDRVRLEYAIQLALLTPLMAVRGYTSDEVEQSFSRAIQLAEEIGDTDEIFPALNGRQAFEFVTGQIDLALVHAEEAIQLAGRNPNSSTGAFAGRFLGTIKFFSGDIVAARPLLEHILVIYDDERHKTSALLFGQDHFVASASYLSLALWHLGYVDQARASCRLAFGHARKLNHMNTLGLVNTFSGGCFGGLSGDVPLLQTSAIELTSLGATHSFPVWSAVAIGFSGKLLIEQGRMDAGIAELRRGIDALAGIRVQLLRPMFLSWLAAACKDRGDVVEGLAALSQAWQVAAGGEHWMDSELHRLHGELLLMGPSASPAAAEESLFKAITVAQRQASRTLELRAATSLARLWQNDRRYADARAVLEPVRGWFNEGLDVADVRNAQALLLQLADL